MASRQVGTLTLPLPVAGHPALELCNTRAGWGDESPREYLTTYAHLVVWAREVGLVPPATAEHLLGAADAEPGEANDVLERVTAFRADLYAGLTEPRVPAEVLDRLGAGIAAAAASLRLDRSSTGGLVLGRGPGSLELPLHAVADATRSLVDQGLTDDVGRCPGNGCGWLFLRNGRPRRWCIMSICGNRAKARRFAQRRRSAQPA